MEAISSIEIIVSDAHVCRKCDHTSATVSAHHTSGAIRIVIIHTEIICIAGFKKHQPVRTHTITTVADRSDLRGRKLYGSITVVGDQEIVSSTLILIEFHLSAI